MDRGQAQSALRGRAMRAHWFATVHLLLQSSTSQCGGAAFAATCRRDLYQAAILRISENPSGAGSRGLLGQSKEGPEHHEKSWSGGMPTRTSHIPKPSKTSEAPLSFERVGDCPTLPSLEHGHHLHKTPRRVCLSNGRHRLVQSPGTGKPSIEQLGRFILPRGSGAGAGPPREARDIQHRSRSAVHLHRVCRCCTGPRYPTQHGWPRASSGQYFCRKAMEVAEVRRGVSS